MRIKKLLALGLATIMAVSAFTACGGNKDKKTAEVIEIELTLWRASVIVNVPIGITSNAPSMEQFKVISQL